MIRAAHTREWRWSLTLPSILTGTLRALPLALVLAAGGLLCGQDMTSEAGVQARGDSARYLMNGAFFFDLVRDAPSLDASGLLRWAQLYYARYPALSIGHHPILLPIVEAAGFAVFGLSVFSARLIVLLFFTGGIAVLYALIREVYDDDFAAFIGAAILATNPVLVHYGRSILSDAPTVALSIGAVYMLAVYGRTGRLRHLVGLATLTVLSLYSKQLAIFLIPLAAIYLAKTRGWRHLLSWRVIVAAAVTAMAILPLVFITVRLSSHNVTLAMDVARGDWPQPFGPFGLFVVALKEQFLVWVALVAGAATLLALLKRDTRATLFIAWIALVFLQVYWFTGELFPERYAIYWIPAFAGLAASLVTLVNRPEVRWASGMLVLVLAVYSGVATALKPTPITTGYDEAAEYIVRAGKGDSVLFDGPFDTGLFVFDIRKRDPKAQMVVLRADKVFATSRMIRTVDRIATADEIYAALDRFGTAFVVVEETPTGSPALALFRQQLMTSRFAERRRWIVRSSDPTMDGMPLIIYEYLHATAADRTATLDLDLPLAGQSITLRFGDLLDQSDQRR